jgi:hypothetical protein
MADTAGLTAPDPVVDSRPCDLITLRYDLGAVTAVEIKKCVSPSQYADETVSFLSGQVEGHLGLVLFSGSR